MDTREIIKKQFAILPANLQAFLKEEIWRQNLQKIGQDFALEEEKLASLENEVFVVLIGLEPKVDLPFNLKTELDIEDEKVKQMVEKINKEVFSKVDPELDIVENQLLEKLPPEKPTRNIGQSFEQIILNQAKAMQPARNNTDGTNRPVNQSATPENLPIAENEPIDKKPGVIHNYLGQDPYREPLE